jgi:glycosyltransferase involved in cell wall biosynthesis
MKNVSICLSMGNRAHLFRYMLESVSRQDYDSDKIEICIADSGSKDNLLNLIDRYSDVFKFRIAVFDRNKAYLPRVSNCPAANLNVAIKYIATNDIIIKTDPEIIMKDSWLIQEIVEGVESDPLRTYNARCHFTEGSDWYMNYEDIVNNYEKHYHYAEGGPFSRSKFYFCSGFSRDKFIELGGVEELFSSGVGYEDTHFRDVWKNRYGEYEKEISAEGIHLFHGHNKSRPVWEKANERLYNYLKDNKMNNMLRLRADGTPVNVVEHKWGNPEMLSKIYTIKDSQIIDVEDINQGNSVELSLPF